MTVSSLTIDRRRTRVSTRQSSFPVETASRPQRSKVEELWPVVMTRHVEHHTLLADTPKVVLGNHYARRVVDRFHNVCAIRADDRIAAPQN